eukprot:Blabericola_migrator_1__5198@NODE_267_length_10594_cov_56_602451_g223_i0_p10_GENE_NODE_267_length_10594_cov_56_602451_g223_i0NODE_267_length_10594_cov_56_602451_g223_i0_p10_ORF_typecomplete_len105_score13_04_NODE_267_length_10594_cov_56_602451_g223_i084068720
MPPGLCMSLKASATYCPEGDTILLGSMCQSQDANGKVVLPDIQVDYITSTKVYWTYISMAIFFPFLAVMILLVLFRGCFYILGPKTQPLLSSDNQQLKDRSKIE